MTINPWIVDFSERIKQLYKIANAAQTGATALRELSVWLGKSSLLTKQSKHHSSLFVPCQNPSNNVSLGGLFTQEAYVTATRQSVAQVKGYSLEELELSVSVHDTEVQLLT